MRLIEFNMIMLLDSGPLGLVTNPQGGVEAQACKQRLSSAGHLALLPGIVDYEHRRELLLAGLNQAITRLDGFKTSSVYLPVSQAAYETATQLWAIARRQGMSTADRLGLDVDAILSAQAITLDHSLWQRPPDEPIVIATTNIGHLTRFTDARLWQNIP